MCDKGVRPKGQLGLNLLGLVLDISHIKTWDITKET